MRPSDLLALFKGGVTAKGAIALDTETSGLYADDGARVATVSIAFEVSPDELLWGKYARLEAITDECLVSIASFAWPFDQGIAGKPEDKGQRSLFGEDDNLPLEEWQALIDWLKMVGPTNGFVMHPAKFDCEKMRVGVRRWPGVGVDLIDYVIWDSQNANHLLWPLRPDPNTRRPTTSLKPTFYSLWPEHDMTGADEAALVKKYLKKAKLPPGRWDLMPWDVIGTYADNDARMTKMLELRQKWEIDHGNAGQWLYYAEEAVTQGVEPSDGVYDKLERRLQISRLLYRMEWRGLPYDEVGSREAAIECENRAKVLAEALPFAPTLNAAKDYFFTEKVTSKGVKGCNMVPYSVTDTGAPQMTAEIVDRMVDDEIPYAAKWAEYAKVTNAASMWYRAYAEAMGSDGRLRTCFRQNGTRSTRFSVERVNLQAIPQDYRLSEFRVLDGVPTPRALIANAVKAMPGWGLWELDLAQAELRVASLYADCQSMLEMIANGDDLHSVTTKALFNMDTDNPRWGEYRQVGKRGNFSLIFGSGWKTFQGMVSKEVGIRLQDWESQKIVSDWNALYPEFRKAIDRHESVVQKRQVKHNKGWVDLVTGERRWFERYEETHKAFNQRVQPNLAQFGMDWMLMTDDFLRGEGLDKEVAPDGGRAGLLLTIHDSQVLLLPDDAGERLAAECARFGQELWPQFFNGVPGAVDYKRWDK